MLVLRGQIKQKLLLNLRIKCGFTMCDFGDKMSCVITSEEKTNISREGACETSRSSKIVVFYICAIYINLSVWKVGKNSKYPILITCIGLRQTEQGELILDQ